MEINDFLFDYGKAWVKANFLPTREGEKGSQLTGGEQQIQIALVLVQNGRLFRRQAGSSHYLLK